MKLDFKKKALSKLIPLSFTIELTHRCNLKCVHCFQKEFKEEDLEKELTLKELENIFTELSQMGVLGLAFTGGEPLLRKDFFSIVKIAREKTFNLILLTNGILITEEIADNIKELNFFKVKISLYGAKPETHDKISKSKGSFKKVIKAIKLLKERNIKVTATTPLCKLNFNELLEIQNLTEELGVISNISPLILPSQKEDKQTSKLRLNDDELKFYYHWAKNKYKEKYEPFNLTKFKDRTELCSAGKLTGAISPYGDIYPCVGLPFAVGNVRKNNIKDIWFNSENIDFLRKVNYNSIDICYNCDDKKYCLNCIGINFLESGYILNQSVETCRLTKFAKEVLV